MEAWPISTILLVQKCVCQGSMGNRRGRELTMGGLRPRQIADESGFRFGGTPLRIPGFRTWACRNKRSSKRPAGLRLIDVCFIIVYNGLRTARTTVLWFMSEGPACQ